MKVSFTEKPGPLPSAGTAMAADTTFAPGSNYEKQGGAQWDVGGVLDILAGGVQKVAGVAIPASVSMAAAAGGANVSEVTFTVKDGAGATIAGVFNLDIWLSDAATGEGLTGTTASGAVAAKASSGTDLSTLVSKKALRVQTKATGVYILSITDTAKSGFYPCAQVPGLGRDECRHAARRRQLRLIRARPCSAARCAPSCSRSTASRR
jgi:hypothetical protein